MIKKGRMYEKTQSWNPFKGCRFDCIYCEPSFKRQAKRQKHNCMNCYHFRPHYHPERLNKIPNKETIFVCGNSDLSFCRPGFTREIIESIRKRNRRTPDQTYYFQSKRPEYFRPFLNDLPSNAIILTTMETNRDEGYRDISQAPLPSQRFAQFKNLNYPRKVVTIEPVLDFDLEIFVAWIKTINPEYVYIGYNSRPKQVQLPEPDPAKLKAFIQQLKKYNIEIKEKDLRK